MTRQATYLLLWGLLMWGSAVLFQVEAFYTLAALSLATEVVALVLLTTAGRGLSLTRAHASTLRQGDSLRMEFVLTADKRFSQGAMLLFDNNPACGDAEAPIIWLSGLRRGESQEVSYTQAAVVRGNFQLGEVEISIRDPLGFFERRLRFDCPSQLLVLPAWEPITYLPLASKRRGYMVGMNPTTVEGAGQELYGVREYRVGDNISQMHWRSTARLDRPMIRQYENENRLNVALFVDTAARRADGEIALRRVDQTAAVACSLAMFVLSNGSQVSCHAHGQESAGYALQGGDVQKQLIMRYLSGLQPETLSSAAKALAAVTRKLSGRDVFIAVLTRLDVETISALSAFAFSGGAAIVFLVTGSESASRAKPTNEQARFIEGLKAFDIPVVRVGKPGRLDRSIQAWLR